MTDPIETTSASAEPATAALEIVETPTPALSDKASQAVVEASNAAMVEGMPGREEFLNLAVQARLLSMSGAAQKAVRDNPHVALHMALVARDLGISLSSANEQIDIIPGPDGPRFSLSPQLLNGQIRRLGLGAIRPLERTLERCVAVAIDPAGNVIGESEFTWEDAKMAGLVGDKCTPGAHVKDKQRQSGAAYCGCNQGYITYPKRMLWWRAAGFAADDFFPEASMGLYSPEALGMMVDEDGRAIDPATVEVPEGYEDTKAIAAAKANEVDFDDLWMLRLRMLSLPTEQFDGLAETWTKSDKIGELRWHQLNANGLRLAQAMVSGAESKARTANPGWNTTDALAALAESVVGPLMPPWSKKVAETTPTPPESTKSGPAPAKAADDAPTPDPEPEKAPVAPAPATTGRARGTAAIEPTEADLEGASPKLINDTIAEVLKMHAPDVDKELTFRGLHTEGELDARKHRLSLVKIRDAKAADQA